VYENQVNVRMNKKSVWPAIEYIAIYYDARIAITQSWYSIFELICFDVRFNNYLMYSKATITLHIL